MAFRKTIGLLPEIFRTDRNEKFLNATVDQLVTPKFEEKINAYVGRKSAPSYSAGDQYVNEPTATRQNYQLEPGIVFTHRQQVGGQAADRIEFLTNYVDMLNRVNVLGGNIDNHDRLFENEYYTWSSFFDFDKFVNFSQYYWLPNGPDAVQVFNSVIDMEATYEVTRVDNESAYFINQRNSVNNPTITLARGGTYQFEVGQQGFPFWIQTEPGLSGTKAIQGNISTRDILGVENNGDDQGIVTFNVPDSDAQNLWIGMTKVADVDFATELNYTDVNKQVFSAFIDANPEGFDGIIERRVIDGATLIFYNTDVNEAEGIWESGGLFDTDGVGYDGGEFDPTNEVPEDERYDIWQISINDQDIIELSRIQNIPQNQKVLVTRGEQFGNLEFWKNAVDKLEKVPVITAPLTRFYYQDGVDELRFGIIDIVESGEVPILDVERDILGQNEYISLNRVEFTNGMKIELNSDVTPSEYADRQFYVEGVGQPGGITLTAVDELIVPETYSDTESEGFDTSDFDTVGYDGSSNAPLSQDYFTINRSSKDRNAWSRSNRWVHIDVIEKTSQYNNFNSVIDQDRRANRPIIEFEPDLQLYNYGRVFKQVVTCFDETQLDALSNVEGQAGYFVDGIPLLNGVTVIWAADEDPIVRNKIYEVSIIDPDDDGNEQIHMTEVADVEVNDTIIVTNGNNNQGIMFHYDGENWVRSQQKTKLNQTPYFDIFDTNGNSFSDDAVYFGTGFTGTRLFSYQQQPDAVEDSVLGFGLSYKNFENVGDIIFENNYVRDKFTYSPRDVIVSKPVNDGFVHKIVDRNTVEIRNDWTKVNRDTRQYQIVEYTVTADNLQTFQVPISPKSDEIETVNLFVYKNSKLLKRDTTQNITNFVDTDYTTLSQDGNFYVILDEPAAINDQITIRVYADTVGDFGYYEIPENLENNAKNEDFTTLTLGQIRNHITETSLNSSVFFGDSPGRSNLRDVTRLKEFAGTILQHSAGVHFGAFLLSDENINFKHNEKHVHNANAVISIDFAQKEYTKFKQKFYDAVSTLNLDFDNIPSCVDEVINELKIGKSETFPFFYSDMIGYGEDNVTITYNITNPEIRTYDYGTYFDNSVPSNRSVLVYQNGVQLYLTTDYTFDQDGAIVTFADDLTLSVGDVIELVDYTNTDGSYVPPTPTKMGMYPKFRPEIYTDNTFRTPQTVIQGHDGSIFVAFGDSRDDVILELEKRIYNNIKTTYTSDVFDINDIMGGKFRETDWTREEINDILSVNFLKWAVLNKVDYANQVGYDIQDKFTWNWSNFTDKVDGELLPGHWRGVYRYFYDTDRPHTHPWEMLGLTEKPLWWDDRYGVAPYTKGNEVMWEDLRDGKLFQDAAGEDFTILENYKRPNLMSIIPVDVNGRLVDPLVSVVAAYNTTYTEEPYSFGDVGPAESAWRRSSDYPFAIMRLCALANPSKFLLTRFDVDNIIRNTTLDQIVDKTTLKRIKPQNLIVHGTLDANSNVNRINGISQIISDYARHRNVDLHNIQEVLEALELKLVYRVGGYTDKRFLKVLAEQVSPTSTNKGIFIPDDDYEIELTKSNPITSVSFSGIVVSKTNSGWTVSGYDFEKPYFDVIPSEITSNNYTISGGDATGIVYREFRNEVLRIPYNTEFTNKQQVVDFLVSYQRYLELQGFVFDETLEDEIGALTKDWILSAKEFLFWQSQGWANGSTIGLNPVADKVKFELFGTTPDDLGGEGLNYKVLNQNLKPIRYNQLEVKRVDNQFTVTSSTAAGPIYMIEINPVQYEHTIVFNNTTVFNDVLYQPQLGSRQYRLKLIGTKTGGWDGSFQAPGYVFNNDVTATWQPGLDYKKGDFVVFRKKTYVCIKDQDASQLFEQEYWTRADNIKIGLRPNLDTLSNNFTGFYDMDSQNNESEFDRFGKGLIGYQKRDYLENLELDDVSQVKFYQGMIRQKGTSSAINKLIRAQLDNQDSDINFFEEWAFRVGEYGAIDANQIIEVELDESRFTANPELIEFLNNGDDRPQHISYIEDDLFKKPNEYTKNIFTNRSGGSNTKLDITSAGFPRLDDVDTTIFDMNDISTLNNRINDAGSGFTIWAAKNLASVWDVYRVSETFTKVIEVVDKLDNEVVVRTDKNHNLNVNDFVAIRGTETILDGFYKVLYIVSNVEFIVELEQNELNETDLDGLLLTLESVRYDEPKDIATYNPLLGWQDAERTWLENNEDGKWEVLKKQSPWDFGTTVTYTSIAGDENLGTCFSSSERNLWAVAGIPNSGTGKVISYVKTVSDDFSENAVFDPSDVTDINGFGTSVSAGNSDYFVVGAPTSGGNNQGLALVYKRTQASTFAIHQVLRAGDAAIGDRFGTSVALSDDEKWLYISAPGASKIYAYAFDEISASDEVVVTEEGDGIKTSSTLYWFPESIDNIQIIDDAGRIYVPYVDYTLSGNTVNFTFTLNALRDYIIRRVSLYRNIDTIVRDADPQDTAADSLGQTLETNSDGKIIVAGAPNRRYFGTDSSVLANAGAAYIFERTAETFNGDGTTTTFTPTGTLAPQRLIKVYLNNDLKIYTVNLSLPGDDSQFGDYTISSNSIVFRDAPTADELVRIEVNDFIQVQKLEAPEPTDSDLFGNDVTINEDSNWIVVGAPGEDAENTNTGSAYVYTDQSRRYGTITGDINPTIVSGDKFRINDLVVTMAGTSIDSVKTDIDALTISGVTTSGDDVLTIDSSSVITGNKLRVMPLSGDTYKNLGLEPYAMVQRIDHPQLFENENFGKVVDIDRSGNFLVVGSDRASTINTVRFDVDEDDIETTVFDSNSTKFYDREDQSGAVYVYDLLESWNESVTDPAQFGYIQQLQSDTIETFDEFGSSVNIREGKIVVGSPKYDKSDAIQNSGILYEYNNPSEVKGWVTLREEDDKVDVELLNKVFVYNRRNNEIVQYMDWIDPIKGKISGLAQQELAYIVERDPANYNVNSNVKNTITSLGHWNEKQVGQLWWDVSTVRYVDYEQGELSYRTEQWGAKFPGSSIDVYEWVESNNLPSAYSGEGTPKYPDDSSYVAVQAYNPNTDTVSFKYYFWVKDVSESPNNGFRKLGASSVARIIDNPKTYGLKYLSVIKDNAIIAYNIASDLEDENTILHVNFDVIENSNVLHSEYQLLSEGDPQSVINDKIYTKFVDSLSGTNDQGDSVPQRNLSTAERYGVLYRPRQTMFVDKDTAVELFVDFCNEVFAQYQVANQFDLRTISSAEEIPGEQSGEWNESVNTYAELTYLNPIIFSVGYKVLVLQNETVENLWTIYTKQADNTWLLSRVQAYDTNNYWERTTWYAPGFTENTVVTYAVETEPDLEVIKSTITSGELVKVKSNDQGVSSIVQLQDDGTFLEVVVENATIKLKNSLFDNTVEATGFDNAGFDNGLFEKRPVTEIRQIIEAVKNDIFVEDIRSEWNRLWFTMIEYILTEQPYADWLFKTSFIKVIQKLRGLDQYPNYQRDNQDYIRDYINEAKPYRTNIREYILQYTKDDPWDGDVTDFDVHSYFDIDRQYYRKPSGEKTGDAALWLQGLNSPWGNNYTYELGSVSIINAGSGYLVPPVIAVVGGGGTGATVEARTNGDVILSVTVTNPGSGYTTTPTFEINGVGTGLEIYPNLINGMVREFDQTLKFDRITYSSTVIEWAANTSYSVNDIVSYLGEAYIVDTSFTSGSTFDAANMSIYADENFDNNADRIQAYYAPTEGMIGKDITQLQFGTDYSGVRIYGPDFSANPGFDVAAFDVEEFDAFEIDENGVTVISGASSLDAIIRSSYTDAALGTAPEDINIEGGAYIDTYNSHSPEEFVPGIIFDTLDLKVYSLPGQDGAYDGNASRIYTNFHTGDGSTAVFSYRGTSVLEDVDSLFIWTDTGGALYEGTDFTVDYVNGLVTFSSSPAANDTIYIYSYSTTGEKPVGEKSFIGDGVEDTFSFTLDSTIVQQAYVLVDGVESTDPTITLPSATQVDVTLSSVPADGSHVHIMLYNVDPAERVAYSAVTEQTETSDGSTRVIALDNTVQYADPLGANIIVEVNGSRLRPPNVAYYQGDGDTTTFYSPTTAGETGASVSNSEIFIGWIDYDDRTLVTPLTNKTAGTDYVVNAYDGSSVRSITFIGDDSSLATPSNKDTVIFGVTSDAEYTVSSDGNTLTIDPSVALSPGDTIRIISFSNHDMQRIQTNVFVGSGDTTPGQRFTLDRNVSNTDYLWVTVDGTKLHSAVDYTVSGNTILIADSIVLTGSSVVVVSGISENIAQPSSGFRIFKDMLNDWNYYRISADESTTLTQDLNLGDETIYVTNASVLAEPDTVSGVPGFLMIDKERITYWEKNNTTNTISGIRRGTSGTGAKMHSAGANVIDVSGQLIPGNTHTNTWYTLGTNKASDGKGLQNSDTVPAKYLVEKRTLLDI